MRSILMLCLLVTTALAGCSDPAPVATNEEQTAVDEQLEATATTGVIRGVVVDNAIVPIEGVTIRILSLGLETTSLSDGSFGFSNLEPGSYFLEAPKLCYFKVQSTAPVEAGVAKPRVVRIQMEEDLASLPRSELMTFNGYLQCGAGLGATGASTNPCFAGDSVNVFDVDVSEPINTTQIEMIWEGTNVFGDGLDIGIHIPGTLSNFVGSDGPSPRILPVAGSAIEEHYGPDFPSYTLRVFPGTSTEASIVVEQPFTIYVTHFYGFAPDENWAFVNDGEHVDPY